MKFGESGYAARGLFGSRSFVGKIATLCVWTVRSIAVGHISLLIRCDFASVMSGLHGVVCISVDPAGPMQEKLSSSRQRADIWEDFYGFAICVAAEQTVRYKASVRMLS